MDVIDGILDSHYSFTASRNRLQHEVVFTRQLNATEREIKLNHLNVLYFTFKIFRRNVFSFGLMKIVINPDQIDEKYILIS